MVCPFVWSVGNRLFERIFYGELKVNCWTGTKNYMVIKVINKYENKAIILMHEKSHLIFYDFFSFSLYIFGSEFHSFDEPSFKNCVPILAGWFNFGSFKYSNMKKIFALLSSTYSGHYFILHSPILAERVITVIECK